MRTPSPVRAPSPSAGGSISGLDVRRSITPTHRPPELPPPAPVFRALPASPPGGDGTREHFWRCRDCKRVNFQSDTVCHQCNAPASSHGEEMKVAPASIGVLSATGASAVTSALTALDEHLHHQRRQQEREISSLRSQLEAAQTAHQSLLASASASLANIRVGHGQQPQQPNTTHRDSSNSPASSHSAQIAALEKGFHAQLAALQQQNAVLARGNTAMFNPVSHRPVTMVMFPTTVATSESGGGAGGRDSPFSL
jgi:hypothetical protein